MSDQSLIQRADEVLELAGYNRRYSWEMGRSYGYAVRLWDGPAMDNLGRPVVFDFKHQARAYCECRNAGASHRMAWIEAVLTRG